jgi:two-component system NarL family sensor kinase
VAGRRQKQGRGGADESSLQVKLAEARQRLENREVECRVLSALLSGSLDASVDPTAILDSKGAILATNLAWQQYCQTGPTAPGSSYLESCGVPVVGALVKRVLQGQTRDAFVSYSTAIGGATRWYETHIARIDDGTHWLIVIHHDVTENEAARRAVLNLTEQLVSVQEEERERIARELHDSTSQHLAAVGLQLMRLRHAAQTDPGCAQIIGEISASLRQAQVELRAFTYLLHPPELDRDGLKSTIEAFVAGVADRTGLKCRCRIDGAVDKLAFEIRRSIFRVLQEALANVYRHAEARRVYISLQTLSDSLRLLVKDDGRGMSKTCAPGIGRRVFGVGIPGMQARMHRLGGSAVVKSTSRGTSVIAMVPVRRNSDNQNAARTPDPVVARSPRNGRLRARPTEPLH